MFYVVNNWMYTPRCINAQQNYLHEPPHKGPQ
jgi:hypothetical protein